MLRPEVIAFAHISPLPAETAEEKEIKRIEDALGAIKGPVSDEEAELLVQCFGVDECYGLAWTLVHLVETAPGFRVTAPPKDGRDFWRALLHERAKKARLSTRD